VHRKYLYYLGEKISEQIRMKTHGNTMTHITKGSFNAIEIPLPPLLEQKRIVAEIERLAESIDAAKELVDKYESEIRDVVESLWHG